MSQPFETEHPLLRRAPESEQVRLQRKLEDLEFEVEQRESQNREMTRKLRALEESESSLRVQLDSFTKQAKETYKKFDGFLEDAEEIAEFSCSVARSLGECFDRMLEAIASQRALSFREAAAGLATHAAWEKADFHLRRLQASQNLRRKKLFVDPTKFDLSRLIQASELQPRYDKVLEELGTRKDNYEALTQTSSSASNLLDHSDRTPKPPVHTGLSEESRDDFFEHNFKAFLPASAGLVESLRIPGQLPGFPHERQAELLAHTSVLFEALVAYLARPIEQLNPPIDPRDLRSLAEKQLLAAKSIEVADLAKLQELREQNRRLVVLRGHIQNLSNENDELHRSVNLKEFSLLEQNQLIVALERNVSRKNKKLKEKQEELLRTQERSERLHLEAAELLRKVLVVDQKIVAASTADQDTSVALAELKKNLERKKKELENFEAKTLRSNSLIQETIQDIELLDSPSFGANLQRYSTPVESLHVEIEPGHHIKRRVRQEIDSLLAQGKPPLGTF